MNTNATDSVRNISVNEINNNPPEQKKRKPYLAEALTFQAYNAVKDFTGAITNQHLPETNSSTSLGSSKQSNNSIDSTDNSSSAPSWLPSGSPYDPNDATYPSNNKNYDPTVIPNSSFSIDPSSINGIDSPLAKFINMLTWLDNNRGNKLAAEALLTYANNANNPKIDQLMDQSLSGGMTLRRIINNLLMSWRSNSPKACLHASKELAKAIQTAGGLGALTNSATSSVFDELIQNVKNPFYAMIFLCMMLGENGNQNQLAGYGNVSNVLTQGNNQASALAAQFSANTFHSDSIDDVRGFAKNLYRLYENAKNNPALAGIKDSITSILKPLLNKPLIDTQGNPTPWTIKTALKATGSYQGSANSALRSSLTTWSSPTLPNQTNPNGIPISNPDFTTWMNAFNTTQKSFSNQSQTVNTETSLITNNINQTINSITGIEKLAEQIQQGAVQNQKAS